MKLLITAQAVDQDDPALGFFVRWIEEFAKHCEQVTVICLRKGSYELPQNVRVFALGGGGKFSRAYKLMRGAYRFRGNYDAVFVHMNPEYVLAAGWLWRLLRKKVGLWYVHKSVDLKLRIAEVFATTIFTASRESFRLTSSKVRIVGHGIDTDFFSPGANISRGSEVLAAGRLMPSKRHDLVVEAMQFVQKELLIAGEGPEESHLESLAHKLGVASRVRFLGARTQPQMRDLYQRSSVFAHTSETGSLDKVVLEALACGCPVVTTSRSLGDVPAQIVEATPQALAHALMHPPVADVAYVRNHHSLQNLIPRLIAALAS